MSTSTITIPSFIGNDYFCDTSLSRSYTVTIPKASTQMIPSGMDKDVAQTIHAALFQICATIVHRGL